ncbi:thioredoxin-like protein [Podospora fimiseda]|uniref:Thioredoxin-like protein n=1 Tax=Podospora fimiseda TaxID=252190 RepID=A0AAN7GQB7_9PEZI|nr:thioredoxin-like protein [Podospora fimiseda]
MADPISITTLEELADIALQTKYVILDFTAEWCPPCKAIAPLFKKLSNSYSVPGQLAFIKIDVDAGQELAKAYHVTSMPTFIILVDGEPTGVDVGGGKKLGGGTVYGGEGGNKVVMIRGADPRNLTVVASELGEIAKKAATEGEKKPAEEKKEGEEKNEEEVTA